MTTLEDILQNIVKKVLTKENDFALIEMYRKTGLRQANGRRKVQ
jgi:hypothetical protein